MSFSFENADIDAWKPSQGIAMPEGNYVCTITEVKGGRSSGNHPQIELTVANETGATCRDWLTYGEINGVNKVARLFFSAGVALKDTDVDENGMILEAKVQQLLNHKVGVVARSEASRKDPTKSYVNPKGYLPPDEVKPLPTQGQDTASATAGEQDIAF